jgi:hypothetical protein
VADSIQFKDFGIGRLKADIQRLKTRKITLGLQGASGAAKHPAADATVAQVAAWNEYGTDTSPARPFLAETFERHEDELVAKLRRGISDLVDGRASVEQAIANVGEAGVDAVRDTIDQAEEWAEPLAESTKARKGHGQPLIDSDTLRGSISWAERNGDSIVQQGGEDI